MELSPDILADADGIVLFATFIILLMKRRLILPRELDKAEQDTKNALKERDEYKGMVLQSLNIGERAVRVAEEQT